MTKKRTRNKPYKKATDNKTSTKKLKSRFSFWAKISFVYSVILTFLTLYSWFPKLSVEPNLMYFDGDHDTFQIQIINKSFIPVRNISAVFNLRRLIIDNNDFSRNIQATDMPNYVLESNKPKTVHFRLFKVGIQPIKNIKQSELYVSVSYSLPLIPWTFSENFMFSAIKDSRYSIRWLQK